MSLRKEMILLALAAVLAGSRPAAAGRFGTECQSGFQHDWLPELSYVWDRCSGFNDELNDTDTKAYYYNLHDAKSWWEGANDQNGMETVNLLYSSTHGGGWSDRSVWAMWNDNVNAESINMRLGNESTGLSIMSTYSCETLKFNDDKMWTRMGPIMKGGLRYATGSHDLFYDGWTTDETGEDYADDMQGSHTLKYSWKDGNSDWYVDNDAAVMATGTDESNCENRRDNMCWQNFTSYSRLRDGDIHWYCYSYWSNL